MWQARVYKQPELFLMKGGDAASVHLAPDSFTCACNFKYCLTGGTGELSFEFLNLNNINSTVVDPRPELRLDRQSRWLKVRPGSGSVICQDNQCMFIPTTVSMFSSNFLLVWAASCLEQEAGGCRQASTFVIRSSSSLWTLSGMTFVLEKGCVFQLTCACYWMLTQFNASLVATRYPPQQLLHLARAAGLQWPIRRLRISMCHSVRQVMMPPRRSQQVQ